MRGHGRPTRRDVVLPAEHDAHDAHDADEENEHEIETEGSVSQRLKTWWATALAWWRTHFRKQTARVAALEETVRKMSDAVFTKQLVTRGVTLIDDAGKVRGSLVVGDKGTAALRFFDEDRHMRIEIFVQDGRPGICLYDADRKVRAAMTLGSNDMATVKVCGAGLAESMLMAHNDTIAVVVTDKDGKQRGSLFSHEHGLSTHSWLALLDAEGEVVFKAPPDGYPGQGDDWDWKRVFGGV